MKDRFIIYGLKDPRTGELRYVGKSVSGLKRARSHMFPCLLSKDQTHKGYWLRQLLSAGMKAEPVVLETFETKDDLQDGERFWIAQMRGMGVALTNHTNGGDGRSGCPQSAETRAKISAGNKGIPRTAAQLAAMDRRGRPVPAHVIESIRAIGKRPKSEAHKRAIGNAHRGRRHSAEWCAKSAEGHRNSPRTYRPIIDSNGNIYRNQADAERQTGIKAQYIGQVVLGHRSETNGLKFRALGWSHGLH